MATSESDDFESAEDEQKAKRAQMYNKQRNYKKCIGSDSDDDLDYIPVPTNPPNSRSTKFKPQPYSRMENDKINENLDNRKINEKTKSAKKKSEKKLEESSDSAEESKNTVQNRERKQKPRKPKEALSLGAKKLGATKIEKLPDSVEPISPDEMRKSNISDSKHIMSPPLKQECWEELDENNLQEELKKAKVKESSTKEISEEPPELMSNFKFKDIFKPDGWEALGEDVELPNDLSDDKYHPVLDKLVNPNENSNDNWGGWGSWGMSSLINTATAGVSTLTSHVSQGLTLLEESMGIPDPEDLIETELSVEEKSKSEESDIKEEKKVDVEVEPKQEEDDENSSQYSILPSFGFGNFISSMSSITKYVETTSSKVISGGLDTLETIGKKTMEVLQEGDPGLKKKRAFFNKEADYVLSQILREAKEKADVAEKSLEEKELARKVHFESLFDDFQGLVHLEALEMLSKQCNMKIQQQLINLDGSDLISMQETLDEVKELCDLGEEDEDEEEDEQKNKDLKSKLELASKDLGVTMTYDKLIDSWSEINAQISLPEPKTHKEIFQNSISSLAKFTAYSVERFHKTAELLLIKPRRSTVNEADSLVQLTKSLSSQIGSIANLYCNLLTEFKDETEKSEVTSSITTINLEATNASSYVQEAFRLLIPILQVGAI